MIKELSQSLIDELNLVKLDNYNPEKGYFTLEYGFRDLVPESGHLLWLYHNGSFGMAERILMFYDDTHFCWRYGGSTIFTTENDVRNHLYHLRDSIKKRIKECKENITRRKLIKIQQDF